MLKHLCCYFLNKIKTMEISVSEIINYLKGDAKVYGSLSNKISKVGDSESIDSDSLDWINISNTEPIAYMRGSNARVIIGSLELQDKVIELQKEFELKTIILVHNPNLAFSRIVENFFVSKRTHKTHPSAIIDNEAIISANVYVGANVWIGKAKIGRDCVIYENVWIGDQVTIGEKVIIKPGARIGNDGFGFVKNDQKELEKFPQIGSLIIGDKVEIGANTCIDRGSLSTTIIGNGTKINNLVHIAHNVKIGANTFIGAKVYIGGSATIEDNCWLAPGCLIRDHSVVGYNSMIGVGSLVVKDIPANEIWLGTPAKFHKIKNV